MSVGKSSIMKRVFDARPDTVDFRDRLFIPTLVEVPPEISLNSYKKNKVPILDQGQEGACTGFGLATVANFLLRKRKNYPDKRLVSPRMFYEMAKRYDEWEGEDYSGSSARGAIKGWHKHGVCHNKMWPYKTNSPGQMTQEKARDAWERPLGAYFRVPHTDIVAMHAALAEVGILYATSMVHEGWNKTGKGGIIPIKPKKLGAHAFAIVGYSRKGFWIQNSWGEKWGLDGYALITYDDWMENSTDVWVTRLGAPVDLEAFRSSSIAMTSSAGMQTALTQQLLRPHIISIGNNGQPRQTGPYGNDVGQIKEIITQNLSKQLDSWTGTKHVLIYMHGGLVPQSTAIETVSSNLEALLKNKIYPISFIWKTDYWSTWKNILNDAFSRRRSEGIGDWMKEKALDYALDRIDDALEPIARSLSGKSQWDEMKENAILATKSNSGAAKLVAKLLVKELSSREKVKLHLVGHSAGSIFAAPFASYLAQKGKIPSGPMKNRNGLGYTIDSCTLWAPACTMDLYHKTYGQLLKAKRLKKLSLFTLNAIAEKNDNCAKIYNKSLLYLVSNAFEEKPRIPLFRDGKPLLGMSKFIEKDKELVNLLKTTKADWIEAPNSRPLDDPDASKAIHHGDFDNDDATLRATLARILEK